MGKCWRLLLLLCLPYVLPYMRAVPRRRWAHGLGGVRVLRARYDEGYARALFARGQAALAKQIICRLCLASVEFFRPGGRQNNHLPKGARFAKEF